MAPRPEFLTFDVDGDRLGALRWEATQPDAPTVVALHGITANAWSWDPVAHHLGGAAHLVAVDLRGRGRSFDARGHFGIRRHADDVAAIIDQLGGPVLVAGHSMGAYVALMLARRHPHAVADVVLVDGGTPLPIAGATSVDEVLDATLGPAIERLSKVWPDRASYLAMWSNHAAFADGISTDLERNLLADLVEADGGFRTAVAGSAVRQDGRELLSDGSVRSLLERHPTPVTIIRAPMGLMGAPPPLIGDDMVEAFDRHHWVDAPGTNHYTVLVGPAGAALVVSTLLDKLVTT